MRRYSRERHVRLRKALVLAHDRLRGSVSEATSIRIGPWTANPALNLLERGTRSVRIEPRAMDVLVFLAQHDGAVVSVDELIASVWKGVIVGDGSVYLAISQLRQALGESDEGTRYIETIPKRGYRLAVPVERVEPERLSAPAGRTNLPGPALAGTARVGRSRGTTCSEADPRDAYVR